ncbi:MAG: primosomal protein N' [Lachnospira sp.]
MYADIIVDLSLEQVDRPFQYRIPDDLENEISIGTMVNVPFGKGNRMLKGYVIDITEKASFQPDRIKSIDSIVKGKTGPIERQIELACWMKKTYGSTMNQALKTVIPVKDKIKPIVKQSVSLDIPVEEAQRILGSFGRNQRAKYRLLEALIEENCIEMNLVKNKLNISPQTIASLEKTGVVRINQEEQYRNPVSDKSIFNKRVQLNQLQQSVADEIIHDLESEDYKTYLLHGVTGSGKTEVYLEVIDYVIRQGKQVIMLIPEIALTFQTVQRFYHRFGDKVSIMNSRMSKGERYDQYLRALSGEVSIMIGPRSALFTQFPNLGLIVIDEEHENAYKSDVTPKYCAKETAIHIARQSGASVILGSATPSVDSYYKASTGEYKLFTLDKRAGEANLPVVHMVDMRAELKDGNRSVFSRSLHELIEDRLAKNEQIMLFLNRRGIAGFISCRSCGEVIKCPHCDVSLTEHGNGRLVCHYCGYEQNKVTVCPKCGSRYISGFKAGTEAIEKLVHKEFPKARTLRMDMDTTKGKNGHEDILSQFANEQADILIGTQMIVKGHDFPKVTLVGIVAADMSLHVNDFRASERTFQLVVQAAGRSGRDKRQGEVVIQSYSPEHYSLVTAAAQDYNSFYEREIAYRRLLSYPPVNNMIKITLSCVDDNWVSVQADNLKGYLEGFTDEAEEGIPQTGRTQVLGPVNAPIYKIKDVFYKLIYIRMSSGSDRDKMIEAADKYVQNNADFKKITVQYDIEG